MKWGLKTLEISPETIQTEDNLLSYCHTLDDQEKMTECLLSKAPNFMRLLEPKKIRHFISHTWRLSKHNELRLRFTTLIMPHLWHCSGFKWQNENHGTKQWCMCWRRRAQIKLTIDTNGSVSYRKQKSTVWIAYKKINVPCTCVSAVHLSRSAQKLGFKATGCLIFPRGRVTRWKNSIFQNTPSWERSNGAAVIHSCTKRRAGKKVRLLMTDTYVAVISKTQWTPLHYRL